MNASFKCFKFNEFEIKVVTPAKLSHENLVLIGNKSKLDFIFQNNEKS